MKNQARIKYLYFRDIVNIVKACNIEARLHIEEDRIWLKCVDISNVMMVNLNIPKSVFESYSLKPQVIGIDFAKLSTFSNMTYGYVDIIQGFKDLDDTFDIKFESGKYNLTIKNGLDITTIKKEPNDFNEEILDTSAIVSSPSVRKFLKEVKKESSRVKISIVSGDLYFNAYDESEYIYEFVTRDAVSSLDSNAKTSLYSIEYIIDCFKYVKGDVEILMGTDKPCKISFGLDGINIGSYVLAPRIEGD